MDSPSTHSPQSGAESCPPRYTHASCLLTRQKILDAAKRLFARDGFQGATTRAIAREAGVNEVTLFRHFQTREHLLREAILDGMIDVEELVGPEAAWEEDFAAELERFVERYYTRLQERETLVRAIVGEGGRLAPSVREAMLEKKIIPVRVALIERFQAARDRGCLRSGIDLPAATDSLRDCLHAGMLRRTMYGDGGCTLPDYLHTVTGIFLSGIQ